MATRTKEREQYLAYVLCAAIEHNGYGFPGIVEWKYDEDNPGRSYAVIYDRYDAGDAPYEDENWTPTETWRVDIDTMAKGLGIVRGFPSRPEGAAGWVKKLILSDRTNGDDGDFDVVGALLVLECALFGKQVYN